MGKKEFKFGRKKNGLDYPADNNNEGASFSSLFFFFLCRRFFWHFIRIQKGKGIEECCRLNQETTIYGSAIRSLYKNTYNFRYLVEGRKCDKTRKQMTKNTIVRNHFFSFLLTLPNCLTDFPTFLISHHVFKTSISFRESVNGFVSRLFISILVYNIVS
jgi:hypothetical protein